MHHCSIEGRDLAQCIGMPQLARGPVIVQGRRPGQLVTPSRQIYRCHLTLVSDKFLRASCPTEIITIWKRGGGGCRRNCGNGRRIATHSDSVTTTEYKLSSSSVASQVRRALVATRWRTRTDARAKTRWKMYGSRWICVKPS